ncbi:MAG: type II toxin-antitoxin system VapC family toxin [Gallionellaceae bacterium]
MPVRFLLDTNICIYIAKYNPPAVRERFERLTTEELAMSAITLGELRYGAEKSQSPRKASAAIEQLTNAIQVIPIDDAVAQQYGKIRAKLEQVGQMIGNSDLWIAAHAKAERWILVTSNEREFKRVAGLKIENWAKP